jgi:RNA polymerase sigma-70 factor, ECF subfamily
MIKNAAVPDPSNEAEESLIVRSVHGDREAYAELVNRHYENVIHVVYRLCGDARTAEDAAQDAFLRAWIKLPSYQPRAPFQSWLYRIAVNAALDVLRKRKDESLENNEEMATFTDSMPGPEATAIEREQAKLVRDLVKALPEAARVVLVLREYGELSYDDIASTLEIPMGTVMSRLSYARTRLREMALKHRVETEFEYA